MRRQLVELDVRRPGAINATPASTSPNESKSAAARRARRRHRHSASSGAVFGASRPRPLRDVPRLAGDMLASGATRRGDLGTPASASECAFRDAIACGGVATPPAAGADDNQRQRHHQPLGGGMGVRRDDTARPRWGDSMTDVYCETDAIEPPMLTD